MKEFPFRKIKPQKAVLSGSAGCASLEIILQPFNLELDSYSEQVTSSIKLESISLPSVNRDELAEQAFLFPKNPKEGYIDGSIYFFSAHHPVDATRIEFGELNQGRLPVKIATDWELEYENSGFRNSTLYIETFIE